MNIYKVSVVECGYDQYDEVAVYAAVEADAIAIAQDVVGYDADSVLNCFVQGEWGHPRVELLGCAPEAWRVEPGTILASFHAG